MKSLSSPCAAAVFTKSAALVSFNDIAKLFGLTPAQLRAEFRSSPIPLPLVTMRSGNKAGAVSKAGWYTLAEVKRWRADIALANAQRAKRLVLSD